MHGTLAMGETAEKVAERCNVSREAQDRFAITSQQRAGKAIASGRIAQEITPITTGTDKKTGAKIQVTADEHPRPDTTLEALAGLSPIVWPEGTVTAGNASGINDGACALLLASARAADLHGLQPLVRVVGSAVAGVAPRVMGMGPVPATKKLLGRLGLRIDQLDVIELNEAFAAQALAVLCELGIPDDDPRVNPNGGAIALGHPLGASGGRLVGTAARELVRVRGRYALTTMCIGVGQGIAMVLERV
jgi:acetyl-CoA acetyltransferase family protein